MKYKKHYTLVIQIFTLIYFNVSAQVQISDLNDVWTNVYKDENIYLKGDTIIMYNGQRNDFIKPVKGEYCFYLIKWEIDSMSIDFSTLFKCSWGIGTTVRDTSKKMIELHSTRSKQFIYLKQRKKDKMEIFDKFLILNLRKEEIIPGLYKKDLILKREK